MQQIFLILLLVLGGASYWLYNENQTLKYKLNVFFSKI